MSLTQTITHDLTQAMKERSEPKLSTLRMLKSELQKFQADKGKSYEITDDDVYAIIRRLIKQRKESAEQYKAGGAIDKFLSRIYPHNSAMTNSMRLSRNQLRKLMRRRQKIWEN